MSFTVRSILIRGLVVREGSGSFIVLGFLFDIGGCFLYVYLFLYFFIYLEMMSSLCLVLEKV